MVLWRCRRCGCTFAVGLPYCPQCTSTDAEEDDGMAKITRHGGASDATTQTDEPAGDAGEGTGVGAVGEPSRPGAADRKAAWVAWATAAGYEAGYAEAQTKADLQALPDDPGESEDYAVWLDALTTPDNEDEEAGGGEGRPADGADQG